MTAIVVASKSGSSYDAEYVVLTGATFSANVDASDMLYVEDKSSTKNADGWELEVFFLDGSGKTATITADIAAKDNTFYSYSVDDDASMI